MALRSGFVAIVGRPNAGKSTLLNRVLGAKLSIVTFKAQTTREKVLGILTEPGRGQIVFIDTPGIHNAKQGGINEFMVSEAKSALEAPSAVWYIVDPASGPQHEKTVIDLLVKAKAPTFIVMNKVDILGKAGREGSERLEKAIEASLSEQGVPLKGVKRISAQEGKGVKDLLESTWELLPEGPLYYPDAEQLSDRPTRFFVAEKIREQLYLNLGEEIPYSCAVQIEKFDEKAKPPRIEATIHVERDSQKGMVVGKGGHKIKEIGMKARVEIEEFLGQQVFLGLKVAVLKDWTRDARALKQMGYFLPESGPGGRGR